MKKSAVILVILFAGLFKVRAQVADFRGFSWGNPLAKVQSVERTQLLFNSDNDELIYKDVLAGSDCNVVYIFNDNDKLVSGMYIFLKKYSNPQLYLQDYKKFKNLLTEKYGKPANEKYNSGQAIADSNLIANTEWNTDRSVIKIALVTIDKHTALQIHYTTRSLDELENKEELKKALEKL